MNIFIYTYIMYICAIFLCYFCNIFLHIYIYIYMSVIHVLPIANSLCPTRDPPTLQPCLFALLGPAAKPCFKNSTAAKT